MSAALHLAKPEDAERLLAMVTRFHDDLSLATDAEARGAAIRPLLDGVPHGAAYLIGPARAPVGYLVVSFGWSVEFGGLDAMIDEIWVRPSVRGRGIAAEALSGLAEALAEAGIGALHLEVARDNERAQGIYRRNGFKLRDGYALMSRRL